MFTRMVNTLESIGHNIFGEDDNEYYDNDEETRRQRRNDEMVVRDVQNAREFAQFIRDEGALKYLSSSSPRGKISEKGKQESKWNCRPVHERMVAQHFESFRQIFTAT